jgi:hypothetical protein
MVDPSTVYDWVRTFTPPLYPALLTISLETHPSVIVNSKSLICGHAVETSPPHHQ